MTTLGSTNDPDPPQNHDRAQKPSVWDIWKTLPGFLSAVAAVIVAIVTALGLWFQFHGEGAISPQPGVAVPTQPTPTQSGCAAPTQPGVAAPTQVVGMVTSFLCIETEGSGAARAEFIAKGEHWRVCDIKRDGLGVRLYWSIDRRRISTKVGNGTCTEINDDIDDGTPVIYDLCLTDGGKDLPDLCQTRTDIA